VKIQIGHRIRKWRERMDYTQENMGNMLGLSAGAYAKIERGETELTLSRLIQISEALEIALPTFFNDLALVMVDPESNCQNKVNTPVDMLGMLNLILEELAALKKEMAALKDHRM
jgi:transcriptional regulator with XRE-family HTH domain